MLIFLTSELLLDSFNHLSRVATRTKDIKEVDGGQAVGIGNWGIGMGPRKPATTSLEAVTLERHMPELSILSGLIRLMTNTKTTYEDKPENNGNGCGDPGRGQEEGGAQNCPEKEEEP